MNLTAFYNECQSLSENDKKWVDVFYQTVIDEFGEDNQQFQDRAKICSLFYGKGISLSKAQYYRKRKMICKFYDWLADQGAVDKEYPQIVRSLRMEDVILDGELKHHYFKDLDDALNFVAIVGGAKGLGGYDDLLNIKAIIILTWYQVELSDLCDCCKSDLIVETHSILVKKTQIQLAVKHFDILKRFSEIDFHKGFPSQKLQFYVDSPFLMRSAKQPKLNPNNVQKAVQRFNIVAEAYGKELSILSLRRNGLFSRVYTAEDDKTTNSLIQEFTGCDTAFASGYRRFYERWKESFVGGDKS